MEEMSYSPLGRLDDSLQMEPISVYSREKLTAKCQGQNCESGIKTAHFPLPFPCSRPSAKTLLPGMKSNDVFKVKQKNKMPTTNTILGKEINVL